MLVTNELLAME